MNLLWPQGQQEQSVTLGPPGVRQMSMPGLQGQQGQSPTTGPPGGGQIPMPGAATPQAMAAPQGGAQTAVHPPSNNGGGVPNAPIGKGAQRTTSQEYSGISTALERLAPIITDADTSRNLCWQQSVEGDATKLALWKIEATSSPGLQFYAYMQPGEAFMVVEHSMSTIYSTTTDIATLHGKVVLFTGDHKGTRKCVPIILPPLSSFEWKKCSVIDEKEKLLLWYADNPSEHGNLWEPTIADGTKVEVHIPWMIALPLRAASLYHQFKGAVMPHELLNAIKQHLASPVTSLGNGDDWGLVQNWLLVAAQKDGGGGDISTSKSHLAIRTDTLLSNNNLIHRWITEKLDATLGRRPKTANTTVGIQGNMSVVQNMSGIIATEVGRGLGVAMQNAAKLGPPHAGGINRSEEAKPYTQDQVATLLGFHGAMNVKYLMKMWHLFKSQKHQTTITYAGPSRVR